MARERKALHPYLLEPRQPKKCKNCIWGEWTGVKQYCSRQRCMK